MVFHRDFNLSKQSSWIFKQLGRSDSKVVILKQQSKGKPLYAHSKIIRLWLMIINLIGKLLVKGKKLLTAGLHVDAQ